MTKLIRPEDVKRRKPGKPAIYPWDEWMDGQWREATRGEDYSATTRSFRSSLIHRASTRGYRIQTHLTDAGVLFRFTPKTEEGAA